MMTRRELKKSILNLLESQDWSAIKLFLSQHDSKHVINHLFTAICSVDEWCKWNGVRAFGHIVPGIADQNREDARVVMRRFLWSLNDESGGIGWGAPEAMAEIMAKDENLFQEYSHMLISYTRGDGPELLQDGNFLELPALQQGLVWGIAKLLSCRRREMLERRIGEDLKQYLSSPDHIVKGLAAMCFSMCEEPDIAEEIFPLLNNSFAFNLYWNDTIQQVRVCDIAEQTINILETESRSFCTAER